MKKKILFLANHFITLYAFRRELIIRLLNDGNSVYVSLPPDDSNKYFENIGCKVIPTDIDRRGMNPVKDFKLIMSYNRIIRQVDPDIVFSFTIKPNIYGTFVANGRYRQICNITGTGATFLKKTLLTLFAEIYIDYP